MVQFRIYRSKILQVRLQRQLAIIRRQEHASQALLRRMETEVAQLCAQTADQTYFRPDLDVYMRHRNMDSSVPHVPHPDYVTNHRRPRHLHTTLSSSAPPMSGGSTQQDAVDVVMQHQRVQRQRQRRRRKSDDDKDAARRLTVPHRLPALDPNAGERRNAWMTRIRRQAGDLDDDIVTVNSA